MAIMATATDTEDREFSFYRFRKRNINDYVFLTGTTTTTTIIALTTTGKSMQKCTRLTKPCFLIYEIWIAATAVTMATENK